MNQIKQTNKFVVVAGPCVIENYTSCAKVAKEIACLAKDVKDVEFYFKSSFDKANRTYYGAYRGVGINKGLDILYRIKNEFHLKICTDIHEPWQAGEVGDVVDMIQIPAFLCRQTELLKAAAKTKKTITVKKGQFLSPYDMSNVVEKLERFGAKDYFVIERGSSFGYNNLVVDFRGLVIMKRFSKVIFDATHSVQIPGGLKSESGGDREFVMPLLKAASAIGIDGMFAEVHPDPDNAKCDKGTQVTIDEFKAMVDKALELRDI